jgi:ABC-2 type transport system permease protein
VPIHDQGYRRYGGARNAQGRTWWVIARSGLLERLRERKFIGLLIASWLPFLVYAVLTYLSANYGQVVSAVRMTPETFGQFFAWQALFVFFITIYVGSGLIANDRRANALQIYLSKPLTRVEYIVGKLATLVVLLVGVTWLPAMLLLLLQTLFAGNTTFVRENLFLLPAITLYAAAHVFVAAFVMLALSSLSKSRRFVAIMYAGLFLFTTPMYQALRGITRSRSWVWISPHDTLEVLRNTVFRSPVPPAIPAWAAVLVVVILIVVSIVVLERRVRGVEVVA